MTCIANERTIRIQAAVLQSKGGPLTIESLEMQGPRDDEVLVRMAASGICRTDIDFCDEWWNDSDGPVVLGHEGAGVVEKVGRQVKGIQCGDHVVLSYQSCGRCPQCLSGQPAGCDRFWDLNFGFQRMNGSNSLEKSGVRGHFFGQSSFASHCLATDRNIVKVPKDLPLEMMAPMGCGMQTGASTVMNSLKVPAKAGIAVFGTGAVGLAAVMAARIVGAFPIIGVDVRPNRLELALELGATHVIDNRSEDVAARIKDITGFGVDYVIETTDDPELIRLAVEALNPDGAAAYLTGAKTPTRLSKGRKALNVIQGDATPQRFIPKLIAFYRAGLFPVDRLVKTYRFCEINQAMADARRGDTIKPVLIMKGF